MLEQVLGTLNDISLVAETIDESILLLQQLGVLEDAEDLSEKGNWLLVELLRVTDVGRDDLLEGQRLVSFGQWSKELL